MAGVAEEVEVVNQDGAGGVVQVGSSGVVQVGADGVVQVGAGGGDAWSSGRRSAGGGAAAGFGSQICGAEERRRDLGLLADKGWVRL